MKINTKQTLSLAAMLMAAPAFAQVGAGLTGEASTSVQVEDVTTQVESAVETNTAVETRGNLDAEANVMPINAEVGSDVSADVDANAQANTEAEADNNAGADNQSQATIRIDGSLVSVDAAAQGSVNSASEVNNNGDLAIYAHALAQSDAQVRAVNSSQEEVSVTMRDGQARLFGFLNVGMTHTARVAVNEEGETEVQVSKPWWSIFASSDAQMSADLEQDIQTRVAGQASTTLDAQSQARIIEEIHAAFDAQMSARANAQVN